MKRTILSLIIAAMLFVLPILPVGASDFQWKVTCQWVDDAQRQHFWLGYTSDTAYPYPDYYFEYIGNAPGFVLDDVTAGDNPRAIDVLILDDASTVWISLDPIGIDILISAQTTASDCYAVLPAVDAFSITLSVTEGEQFAWQVWDGWNWNDIGGIITPRQEEDGNTFTRLTLGEDNTDHDSSHYRVFAVG